MAAMDCRGIVRKAETEIRQKMSDAKTASCCHRERIGEVLLDAVKRGIPDEDLGNHCGCWGLDAFVLCAIFVNSAETRVADASEVCCWNAR